MTFSGRWMALAALAGLYFGILRGQTGLSLLSLSVSLWLITEWALFLWRLRVEFPSLTIERRINGRSDSSGTLWAGRTVVVDILVRMKSGSAGPLIRLRDVLPENVEVIERTHDILAQSRFRQARYSYRARIRGAGRLRLPGFHVVLEDRFGFFRCVQFVPCLQSFRVLPAYAETGDVQPLIKRNNSLPRHGVHRLQRAGMGSELLELREYVDGDPPKSIAWKVSARRDRLMTRQYESEVPVRVQLFLDGSISTRVGGYGLRLLDQMTFVAASVARTAISSGDPVGAVLFDERGQRRVQSQAGERGFHEILEAIADFCVNPAPVPDRLSPSLVSFALSVASEQFPDLLDVRVNQIPFTFFPLLPWNVRRHRQRVLLAGVLAELYQMSPTRHVQLIYDDAMMATFAQHFLSQTGLAWMTPVVSIRNRGFHDGMARMEMLSQALTTAVTRARDNEVFVILADLLESAPGVSRLYPAVRTAIARHHRVAFVCPTPAFRRPEWVPDEADAAAPEILLLAAEQTRTRELADRLKRELRRLGARVSFSGEQHAIQMVLSETDLARTGRTARTGGSR